MKKIFLFILSILLVGFYSCQPNVNFSKEISEIDSLRTKLEDIKARNAAISLEKSDAISKELMNNLELIKTHFVSAIARKEGGFISRYRSMKKYYKGLEQRVIEIENECNNSMIQLDNLKSDMKNQRISKQEALKYYSKEKEFLNQFLTESEKTINGIEITEKTFNEKNTRIKSIIERMQNANK